jgi:hypothetical protein
LQLQQITTRQPRVSAGSGSIQDRFRPLFAGNVHPPQTTDRNHGLRRSYVLHLQTPKAERGPPDPHRLARSGHSGGGSAGRILVRRCVPAPCRA